MVEQDAARRVVEIATGTWRAQAMYAAAALRLPDHVAAGDRTVEELAERAGASVDGVARLIRLLVAMGVFTGTERTGYRLTEVGDLLRSDAQASMRDMVLLYGEEFHRAWEAIVPAVRAGTSGFAHAFGMPLREYLRDTPGAGAKFQRAMNAGNVFFPAILDAFDFSRCRTVVDVAGGSGMLLSTVLLAHRKVRGVLFETPHMVPVAVEYLDKTVGPDRYRAVPGDAFVAVPGDADAYLLSRVLQDWDDDACVRLLSTIRRAMPRDGRLLVLERVLGHLDTDPTRSGPDALPGSGVATGPDASATPDASAGSDTGSGAATGSGAVPVPFAAAGVATGSDAVPVPEPLLPLLWDLHLMMAAGGRERSLDGYRRVLDLADLRLESVHPLPLETTLLIAAPR